MFRFVLIPMSLMTAAPALGQPPAFAEKGLGGAAIPGLCLLSREAIFSNAKVGVAATARINQLAESAQAEIDAERKPIEAELQALQSDKSKPDTEARRLREQDLAKRFQAVQAKAQLRTREIEATRGKAMTRIAEALQPVIADVYAARKCGMLIDRTAALGGNMTNDLTAAAVTALDAKISAISFDREILPSPQPVAQ